MPPGSHGIEQFPKRPLHDQPRFRAPFPPDVFGSLTSHLLPPNEGTATEAPIGKIENNLFSLCQSSVGQPVAEHFNDQVSEPAYS